jgi:hypothetical protein
MTGFHAEWAALAGRELGSVSAHQALSVVSVMLLVIAALALVAALAPLAVASSSFDGAEGSLALLGAVAALLVIYRMASPPLPAGNLVAVSLREGPWLALLGSAAMVVAGLWPRRERARSVGGGRDQDVWSSMSGLTPQG